MHGSPGARRCTWCTVLGGSERVRYGLAQAGGSLRLARQGLRLAHKGRTAMLITAVYSFPLKAFTLTDSYDTLKVLLTTLTAYGDMRYTDKSQTRSHSHDRPNASASPRASRQYAHVNRSCSNRKARCCNPSGAPTGTHTALQLPGAESLAAEATA